MIRPGRAIAGATLLALACVFAAAPACRAQDGQARTITGSVPAAVRGAFQDAYPQAEIREMASLNAGGKVHYEIRAVDGGRSLAAVFLADGTLVAVEQDIPAEALPEVVAAAIEARHPGAKIVKAVRNVRDGATTYLLKVAAGGRRLTMVLDQDGALISAKDTGGGKRR